MLHSGPLDQGALFKMLTLERAGPRQFGEIPERAEGCQEASAAFLTLLHRMGNTFFCWRACLWECWGLCLLSLITVMRLTQGGNIWQALALAHATAALLRCRKSKKTTWIHQLREKNCCLLIGCIWTMMGKSDGEMLRHLSTDLHACLLQILCQDGFRYQAAGQSHSRCSNTGLLEQSWPLATTSTSRKKVLLCLLFTSL